MVFSAGRLVPVTLLGALLAGTFGALMLNTDSAVLSDYHGLAGPAAISEANALAAGAGLLAPLVIGAAATSSFGWRPGFAVAAALAAVLLLASARVAVPGPVVRRVAESPVAGSVVAEDPKVATERRTPRLPRRYWLAWGVLVLCLGIEFSMTIWAADLLRQQAGLSAGAAAGSLSALIAGVALGRVTGGRLALRRSPEGLLTGSLALTAVGFLLFWSTTTAWLALLGLFVMGLGISVQFPLSVARAILASAGRPDQATARLSIGAGLAIGLAPLLLGLLADQIGTRQAFLIVPVLLLLAGAGLRSGRRQRPALAAG